MSIENVIQQLKAERARIGKALAALGEDTVPAAPATMSTSFDFPAKRKGKKNRKPISPEGKAKIVAALKARWAAYHAKHPKKK